MDFFNSKSATSSSTNPSDGLMTPFGQAVSERYGTTSLLTSAFTPAMPLQTPMVPSAMMARTSNRPPVPRLPAVPQGAIAGPSMPFKLSMKPPSPVATVSLASFVALSPEDVAPLIHGNDTIFIDIRVQTQYNASRIPGSVSLLVPSTLLKRPAFSLDKMVEMIDDEGARSRFKQWKSMKRVVTYDADTSQLADGSNLVGLLRKMQATGFQGQLCWIKGGFNALARVSPASVESATSQPMLTDRGEGSKSSILRAGDLSAQAFHPSSTTLIGQKTPTRGVIDTAGTTSSAAANPFYDNIRQNMELSQGVDTKISLALPPQIVARKEELPFRWLLDIVEQNVEDEAGDELARQFYRIELGEQRRLQGVMEHHSAESLAAATPGLNPSTEEFPYSITAGIEMGTKNRYRNIWPFEHARVRLSKSKGGSDYVNASFVQSLVSSRRYIATQGPLDSTYDDFWAICWDQKVPVIVMLTRETESSLIKCGRYWNDGRYGDVTIQLVSQKGVDEDKIKPTGNTGGFFDPVGKADSSPDTIIERVFQLRNRSQPNSPVRNIVHLQYLGWPDMDVPQSPTGLLTLIKRVDLAITKSGDDVRQGPVLLHCSAGVGRTGGYILVDSILAGVRHEMLRYGPYNPSPRDGSEAEDDLMDSEDIQSVASVGNPALPDVSTLPTSLGTSNSSFGFSSPLHSSTRPTSVVSSRGATAGTPMRVGTPRTVASKPPNLSHLVADNLKKAAQVNEVSLSRKAQVEAWSRGLKSISKESIVAETSVPLNLGGSVESLNINPGPNYKLPRKLDQPRGSPPMPSDFSEPVREVLEDMREQRMSLCQSLRQYVFAHRAIIQGALDLVDEAKAASKSSNKTSIVASAPAPPEKKLSDEMAWSSTSSLPSNGEEPPPTPSSSTSPTPFVATTTDSSLFNDRHSTLGSSQPTPSLIGSRPQTASSPTRLSFEETKLVKRPSAKRKYKSRDSHGGPGDRDDDGIGRPPASKQRALSNPSGTTSSTRGRW